jgi:hypothetical protein
MLLERDWELFTETAAHALLGWAEGETAHQLAMLMRETPTPQLARSFHSATHDQDVSELLPLVQTPTLVLQRRQAPPGWQWPRAWPRASPGCRCPGKMSGSSVQRKCQWL